MAVAVRICGALQTAHEAGVLHRDLKPHNIFVSAYGEPALGDFGISTIDDERSQSRSSGLSIAYAAPEVLEDGDASVASDVYSTGHHAVPVGRRAPPRSPVPTWRRPCGGSSRRRRRGSIGPGCRPG